MEFSLEDLLLGLFGDLVGSSLDHDSLSAHGLELERAGVDLYLMESDHECQTVRHT